MSQHQVAFVPIQTWQYYAPELAINNISVDVGLVCEALIYYDRVIINIHGPQDLRELIKWFKSRAYFNELCDLIKDGTITFYDHSFQTSGIVLEDGSIQIWNIQDKLQEERNSFRRRYLRDRGVMDCFETRTDRHKFDQLLYGRVTEGKSNEFSGAVDNARADFHSPRRASILVNAFLDEAYPIIKEVRPPDAVSTVHLIGNKVLINWGVNLEELSKKLGGKLPITGQLVMTSAAQANRIIWASAKMNADLYIARPMDTLIVDKLYESHKKVLGIEKTINQLQSEVGFPSIRILTNQDRVNFGEVLEIRKKAKKFREWLQQQGERDGDAIIAYHSELGHQTKLAALGSSLLSLCLPIAGSFAGGLVEGPVGASIGAVAGTGANAIISEGTSFIADIAGESGKGWRPAVFGRWLDKRIKAII